MNSNNLHFVCHVCGVAALKSSIKGHHPICSACRRFYQRSRLKNLDNFPCSKTESGCAIQQQQEQQEQSIGNENESRNKSQQQWHFMCRRCRFDRCVKVIRGETIRMPNSNKIVPTLQNGSSSTENEVRLAQIVKSVDEFLKKSRHLRFKSLKINLSATDLTGFVKMKEKEFQSAMALAAGLFRSMPFFNQIPIKNRCQILAHCFICLNIFESWTWNDSETLATNNKLISNFFPCAQENSIEDEWLQSNLNSNDLTKSELALFVAILLLSHSPDNHHQFGNNESTDNQLLRTFTSMYSSIYSESRLHILLKFLSKMKIVAERRRTRNQMIANDIGDLTTNLSSQFILLFCIGDEKSSVKKGGKLKKFNSNY